jgi:tetratricopeptide (TPR) repeat protein
MAGGAITVAPADAIAAPPRGGAQDVVSTAEIEDRAREAADTIRRAYTLARQVEAPTAEELARRLVRGQLLLDRDEPETAAVVFLDLLENHANTPAAKQASFYLAESLRKLDMTRWAAETYGGVLAARDNESVRFHQRALARLFEIGSPPRAQGFARRPGLSATPEARARLEAVGASTTLPSLPSVLADEDLARLERWLQGLPLDRRSPELAYSYGRYLYLRGLVGQGRQQLEIVAPLGAPLSEGGTARPYRVRASYIIAAAMIAMGETEGALERFRLITATPTVGPGDREIVQLAWMAQARIHHDAGDATAAVAAYRRISRDSAYFPEAMYEIAWTLLRAGRNDDAMQALDLLLIYDPDSPIVPEIKQLRGKIKIQERDWEGAEGEFLSLRKEFSELSARLGARLSVSVDATAYLSAVVAEDMANFEFDAIMPRDAARVAESIPRGAQARDAAREVGMLRTELDDLRALLGKMEAAVAAPERVRLFEDLGAQVSLLDATDRELVKLQEELIYRERVRARSAKVEQLDDRRRRMRRALDSYYKGDESRAVAAERTRALLERSHQQQLSIAGLRAQLVATERYYDTTKTEQKIDHGAFLRQAAEVHDEIARLQKASDTARDEAARLQTQLRFDDPVRARQRAALAQYGQFIFQMWGAIPHRAGTPDVGLFKAVAKLRAQLAEARSELDQGALRRLQRTVTILREERVNLDRYLAELGGVEGDSRALIGEVMAATFTDVVTELGHRVTRSEVGLLDVAWAIQEVEAETIRRLEQARDRDLVEVDSILQAGLEDLQ